jgi:hypothetical protein
VRGQVPFRPRALQVAYHRARHGLGRCGPHVIDVDALVRGELRWWCVSPIGPDQMALRDEIGG